MVPPSAPVPPGSGPRFEGVPVGPRPRRRLWVIVAVLVVVLVVIGAVGYLVLSRPVAPVSVDNINLWAPDNVCGLRSAGVFYNGFNVSTKVNLSVDLEIPNYNSTACIVRGITTNTSGFTLYNPGVPLSIPAQSQEQLSVTVLTPSSDFQGELNLVVR